MTAMNGTGNEDGRNADITSLLILSEKLRKLADLAKSVRTPLREIVLETKHISEYASLDTIAHLKLSIQHFGDFCAGLAMDVQDLPLSGTTKSALGGKSGGG